MTLIAQVQECDAPEALDTTAIDIESVLAPDLPSGLDETRPRVRREYVNIERAKVKAAAMLGLKLQGYNARQIAGLLGMSHAAVRRALSRARQRGILDDTAGELAHYSYGLAIEGLNRLLEKGDKDAIIETLRGLGAFKSFRHVEGEKAGGTMPQLQINILNAPETAKPFNPDHGQILGTPRE